jgi:hypothetical protein
MTSLNSKLCWKSEAGECKGKKGFTRKPIKVEKTVTKPIVISKPKSDPIIIVKPKEISVSKAEPQPIIISKKEEPTIIQTNIIITEDNPIEKIQEEISVSKVES